VWAALENPDQPGAVTKSFQRLFRPLPDDKLNRLLEKLRSGPTGSPGGLRPGSPAAETLGAGAATAGSAPPTNGKSAGDAPAGS
jgi:hypothetical protein